MEQPDPDDNGQEVGELLGPAVPQTPPPAELVDEEIFVELLMPRPLKMSQHNLAEYLAIKDESGQPIDHHQSHYHKLFEERFYVWAGEQDRQEWDQDKQNKTQEDVKKMLEDRLRDLMRHMNLFKRKCTTAGTDKYQLSIVDAKQYSQRPPETWQTARVVRDYVWNKVLKRARINLRGGPEDEFDWVLVNGQEGHEDELKSSELVTTVMDCSFAAPGAPGSFAAPAATAFGASSTAAFGASLALQDPAALPACGAPPGGGAFSASGASSSLGGVAGLGASGGAFGASTGGAFGTSATTGFGAPAGGGAFGSTAAGGVFGARGAGQTFSAELAVAFGASKGGAFKFRAPATGGAFGGFGADPKGGMFGAASSGGAFEGAPGQELKMLPHSLHNHPKCHQIHRYHG